jgi:hypothetical protein
MLCLGIHAISVIVFVSYISKLFAKV